MSLIILILDVSLLTGIAIWIYRRQPLEVKPYFWPSLILKILAGTAVGALYFYHYGLGDTISFWQDGVKIARFIRSTPMDALAFYWDESSQPAFVEALQQQAPRSLYFSKIAGILAVFTLGNYWMMAAILSFLAFLGAWHLFRRLNECFPSHRLAAAISFLFFPSVVLWSSGLIKESVGLAALYFLLALCISVLTGKRPAPAEWVCALIALWVGWNLKYYWLGIFLPVAIPTMMIAYVRQLRPALTRYELVLWTGLFFLFLVLATSIHPNFYPSRFLEVIYQSNLDFVHYSSPPRIVQYLNLEPTVASVVMNAPAAWLAGLFRPFIWESFNFLSVMAGLENLFVLLIVLLTLPSLRKFPQSPHRLAILAILVYVGLLVTFLALSTPNFGTLSRYKIGAVPLLVFVCLTNLPWLFRWAEAKK